MAVKKSKDDPAMVAVRAQFAESGRSLVDLGKQMGYPEEMARQAAWQFMKSHDPRMSMLRKFADAMGTTVDQLTVRRKMMPRKLESELEKYGCKMGAADFRETLEEQQVIFSPHWKIDELLCHPEEAKRYCVQVRVKVSCSDLPDSLILRTLMNARKSHRTKS